MDHNPATHEETALLAHQIYEEEGKPEGKSDEHWARAERDLREQRVPLPDSPPKDIPSQIPDL